MPNAKEDANFTPKRGKVTAVLGPTNTGKTHLAIERMLGYDSGMIGLPLRLLAREIYDRIVARTSAEAVALITGEERIRPEGAKYFICTVESMPLDREVEFLAVDEIQLCSDPERGHIFTDRLLNARGICETMFLGAETMRGLLRSLLPQVAFVSRSRFSELTHVGPKKLTRLPRRSAVVAFSAEMVYGLAELMRRQRGGAAVVMGALSPRTRNAQVELYQSGDVDFLVATDAIGMGLNMDVDHVALASLRKFDGTGMRPLRAHEIGQIAGRAGRYMNDGTFGTTGDAASIDPEIVDQVEGHRFDPVRGAQWRNRDLDFSNLDHLIESLEMPPPMRGLMRARAAIDLNALQMMSRDGDVKGTLDSPDDLRQLWSVCQIPDFRNVTQEEHVRLLTNIYRHLVDNAGRLPIDWLKGQVEALDRTDGDIDTLAGRIAHIRTWTFISNKSDWLEDASEWQEKTRAVEDSLSDALHEALTQRFIDRRTSVLMKSLKLKEDLISEISDDGEVTVEGHYVGRLQGFQFLPDPRAVGVDGKALRAAAAKALRAMISARAEQLAAARDEVIELSDRGRLWWSGGPVARLTPGTDGISPRLVLMADDFLEPALQEVVQKRLDTWLEAHIRRILTPLIDLRDAVRERTNGADGAQSTEEMVGGVPPLAGLARGIGYQLVENFGVLDRRAVADQIRDLDQTSRAQLRRFGVRFGQYSIFLPALLKPAQARLLVMLWAVLDERLSSTLDDPKDPPPLPPPPGLCSVHTESGLPHSYYAAAGFRACGTRAVRVDMLERLGDTIRTARDAAAKPKAKPKPATETQGKTETPDANTPATEETVAAPSADASETEAPGEAQVAAVSETPVETDGTDTSSDEAVTDAPVAATPETQIESEPETSAPDIEAANDDGADTPSEPEAEPQTEAETAPQAGLTAPETSEPTGSSESGDTQEAGAAETPDTASPETTEQKPAETAGAEEAAPSKPKLPAGAFEISSDMMSLVGCSGEDFEGILRSLGYRPMTINPEEEGQEPLTAWRYAPRRERPKQNRKPQAGRQAGPREQTQSTDQKRDAGKGKPFSGARKQGERKDGDKHKPHAKAGKGKPRKHDGKPGGQRGQKPNKPRAWSSGPQPSQAIDPDSPFAALAALKTGQKG